MVSLKDIPILAQRAFSSLLEDDKSNLLSVIKIKEELLSSNPLLSEMFFNDFCVEWNKIQANHFIKTNVLLDTGNLIKIHPSIWICEWNNHIYSSISKVKFKKTFDFRTFPFDTFKKEVELLNNIFKNVYKNTLEDYNLSREAKSTLLSYGHGQPTPIVARENITNMIYSFSQLENFMEFINSSKNINRYVNHIFTTYYGRHNKKNEVLFKNYISNKQRKEDIFNEKSKSLVFRDEDSKYWRYFLSIIPTETFKSQFIDVFDIREYGKTMSESMALSVFTKNNMLLLDEELPKKDLSNFQPNPIKI